MKIIQNLILLVVLTTSCLKAKSSNNQVEFESAIKMGSQMFKEGKYKEALPYLEKFLQVSEMSFGENDDYTFTALVILGADYNQLGDYKKALLLHERAYNITKKNSYRKCSGWAVVDCNCSRSPFTGSR